MSAFDKNAEHLKGELRNLKNRFFEIRGDQKCEDCSRGIFTEEFYVFPCGHCYHKVTFLWRKLIYPPKRNVSRRR